MHKIADPTVQLAASAAARILTGFLLESGFLAVVVIFTLIIRRRSGSKEARAGRPGYAFAILTTASGVVAAVLIGFGLDLFTGMVISFGLFSFGAYLVIESRRQRAERARGDGGNSGTSQ
jgi:putative exporter of polyketide antibiotics